MVLNIRQKQTEAVVRLLHLNAPQNALKHTGDDDLYKVLVLDSFTKAVIAPLLRVNELRKHGITMHLLLETDREKIPDTPCIYFVRASEEAVRRIVADASAGLYNSLHLNFTPHLPKPLMEQLATGSVRAGCPQRIAKVFDQYLSFIALESRLFSLGLPDTYLLLNDPKAQDVQVQSASEALVDGLFSVLVTLGVVPIIRCPRGGAAEFVAQQLDARLREHLRARNNLLTEGTPGLSASLSRPLLCLFDRNFELSVVLQHAWTYKPLVQDVLGLSLNRVGEGDFFWDENGRSQFPKVAEEVDAQLQKYKQAVADLNRQTGANVDPAADPGDLMQSNARGLMAAVSSLPELTERKRAIDKHMNLATHMLKEITTRGLDQFYNTEEDCLVKKADLPTILKLLQGTKGTPEDKLRLALVFLLTCEALPSDGDYERVTTALAAAGADTSALAYVRRMRRLNLTGRAGGATATGAAGDGALAGLAGQSHLLNWADKTFGQGLSSLTKGVKVLLAGEQQAAVTVAVEGLMDAKPSPELDSFLTFDPKAAPGRASKAAGPHKEAIVFMIGGGNYLEYESLTTWAGRATPPKSVIYGASDLLTGGQFAAQLAELGRRSGV
ncbi:SM/Sec1-family protein [Coccomyxa subellipsoidea C-169]|uniref:SM/Sec1-family protein n=1 Tax=Coccomyxa subellipsoidea (strain C-169) TaxID=574566 RepID=I0Z8M4_COCSC|nr:SM/Sec1-family protein [Coccomyxa subellipsoidea C-169]EIE26993.1 SM/Sec1-family protein [Coccomyxa subellipsoidea C-169]|eukprot:XP_005651537.1 SM/Sec1-family protein [Coccomyxa subellipsoidea C-169]